jgi:hypothetical protein
MLEATVDRMVIAACSSVFTPSILQEIDAVGFFWTLWKELQHHGGGPIRRHRIQNHVGSRIHATLYDRRTAASSSGHVRRMVELAGLPELARSVFNVVGTGRLVRAHGKEGLGRIDRSLHPTPTLHIGGMIILAGSTVLASACP